MVTAAGRKIKSFMDDTGKKIVKFGLKVFESYETVVAKVAGYIPGLKGVAKAIEGVAKVAGVVGNQIHATLSKGLQKGMNIMDRAGKYLSYIPRRRDLSEEGFQ